LVCVRRDCKTVAVHHLDEADVSLPGRKNLGLFARQLATAHRCVFSVRRIGSHRLARGALGRATLLASMDVEYGLDLPTVKRRQAAPAKQTALLVANPTATCLARPGN